MIRGITEDCEDTSRVSSEIVCDCCCKLKRELEEDLLKNS